MTKNRKLINKSTLPLLLITALVCSMSIDSFAIPIEINKAQKAAQGWLHKNKKPMGKHISEVIIQPTPLKDEDGQTICYIINLEPEGFIILSTDDEIEPVIAFSPTGTYEGSQKSTLTKMLKKDMPQRLENLDQVNEKHRQKKAKKWQKLFDHQESESAKYSGDETILTAASTIDDIRVEPFIDSEWSQENVLSGTCYNYYTPNNYVCGCVATAMAQLMRYYTYPTSGIGVSSFTIYVDGSSQSASTIGGDGSGGAYDWSSMPLIPANGLTTTQRQAIGALCYDAGVAVSMDYTASSSGAYMSDADSAMVNTFQYANSIYRYDYSGYDQEELAIVLNSNLDAEMPVMLGISGTSGGHAVLADGYGYNSETLYHHINMGWGGDDDAWYQLPDIDAYYTFDVVDSCIYNVYPSGTGEIISGRITNSSSDPIEGVTVDAYYGGTLQQTVTTNDKGIYAFTNLTSNRTYTIFADATGYEFQQQNITVGRSIDGGNTGNVCDVDFEAVSDGPPTVFDIEVTDANSTNPTQIFLEVLDDGEPDPNLLHFIITSLPEHGRLTDPDADTINTVPYTMSTDTLSVIYEPCPYYNGADSFTYMANDGGTSPDGGDSGPATVTINVQNSSTIDYYSDATSYVNGMLSADSYSVRTQLIMLQSELGTSNTYNALAINVKTAPGIDLNNWTIRMKHTTRTRFTSYTQVETSGWTTVYQANESLQPGWNWFYFDDSFTYNGSDNLMIDFSFENSSTSTIGYYYEHNASSSRNFIMYDDDGDAGSPLDWNYYSNWDTYSINSYIPSMYIMSGSDIDPIVGDFDYSCDVKMPDLSIFAQAFDTEDTDTNYNLECDLTTTTGTIDLEDFALFIENWMTEYSY